jgi:hypothetical protein
MITSSQNLANLMRLLALTRPLLLLSAICLYSSASIAEMYKWVDADGNTNYTQSPPPAGTEAKTLKPPPTIDPEHAKSQLENRKKILQEARDRRKQTTDDKNKQKQEQAEQKAQCEKARKRLASYQRPRVNLLDKDGNPSRATEEQRQENLEKSRESIKKLCK